MLAVTACSFGLAWWLGLYLLARDPRKPLLRRAGTGLLAYALALACEGLRDLAIGTPFAGALDRLGGALVLAPAICWSGAMLLLLPESQLRARLDTAWRLVLLPLGLLGLAVAALVAPMGQAPWLRLTLGAVVLLPMACCLGLVAANWRAVRPGGVAGIAAAAMLFFGLSLALLIAPLVPLPRLLLVLGAGVDLALLGLAVALFDAFAEGEQLRRDMLRSALGAEIAALLFGGQVGLAIMFGPGPSLPLAVLLLSSVAVAVAAQVLGGPIQALLDRLAFPEAPALRAERAELRATAEALPRRDDELPLAEIDPAEFARLTRRALSHYGDLPRLAASPLTRLPVVAERLAARDAPDQPLERAAELKALLAEGIARLKPRTGDEFGTSDEWRHYNALHFPYVIGLRPYSRRVSPNDLDPVARQALDWLATQVPERTLYNWQNHAARLVAAELWQAGAAESGARTTQGKAEAGQKTAEAEAMVQGRKSRSTATRQH